MKSEKNRTELVTRPELHSHSSVYHIVTKIENKTFQGGVGVVCGDPGGGGGGGRMTRTLNHVERRARKTSATIGSILGGGQVAGSVTSTSSSSSPSRYAPP